LVGGCAKIYIASPPQHLHLPLARFHKTHQPHSDLALPLILHVPAAQSPSHLSPHSRSSLPSTNVLQSWPSSPWCGS
jgi:hypothetical protein